jgi:putative spermidine/putrescine transport system permease protein
MLPQLAAPHRQQPVPDRGRPGATALALVGTRLEILPLQLYSLISETGSDFPAAAALALLITAACSSIMTAGAWFGSRHEKHL